MTESCDLPDHIVDALRNAAHEFVYECGWSLDSEDGVPEPFTETEFYKVLAKHIGPLLDTKPYRLARIDALKAEIRRLEEI